MHFGHLLCFLMFIQKLLYRYSQYAADGFQFKICYDPFSCFDPADGILIYSKPLHLELRGKLLLRQSSLFSQKADVLAADIAAIRVFPNDHSQPPVYVKD